MRISDWSSDVCSSDLRARRHAGLATRSQDRWSSSSFRFGVSAGAARRRGDGIDRHLPAFSSFPDAASGPKRTRCEKISWFASHALERLTPRTEKCRRSEEHTSELQSLMRISYAVLCWKKK